jgi:tRNA pseudouridine13 synthase
MLDTCPYLYGKPESTGLLRAEMADFQVYERLPFEPCGEGEHYFLHIEKTGANTVYVARQLARFFDVKEMMVSYAGLKDRHAVTQQWFSVHVPGKQEYDFNQLSIEGVKVLSAKRHNKKLKTGALSGNTFKLTLRKLTDSAALEQRWQQVVKQGVPNYFGEQRFGHQGGNLVAAEELFNGKKIKDKKKRGIYLSAARSAMFNAMVAQRIKQDLFHQACNGDVMMLGGTQSVFDCEQVDELIPKRLASFDIDITASLWGAGELKSAGLVADLEQQIANHYELFAKGLAKFGLKQERRRIRLSISEENLTINGDQAVIEFVLPAGCYATTVLRELIDYQDSSEPLQ